MSGGNNIVDQQNAFAAQVGIAEQSVNAAHVFFAFIFAGFVLRLILFEFFKCAEIRKLQKLGAFTGKKLSLIVASELSVDFVHGNAGDEVEV